MFQEFPCHFELIYGFLTIPKCDFVEVEKGLFQGQVWHFQPIFGLWDSPKYDFGEFNKATFLVVARICELIFCLLTIPKLVEIVKAMIQVVERHFEVIFCFFNNQLFSS